MIKRRIKYRSKRNRWDHVDLELDMQAGRPYGSGVVQRSPDRQS